MEKINSDYIKTALFYYYRMKKQHQYNATECGAFFSDFLTITKNNELIEVEIKIDLNDLKNDFKKPKHSQYKDYELYAHKFIPSKFFFCVPEALLEDAEKLIKKHNPKYGILLYRPREVRRIQNKLW